MDWALAGVYGDTDGCGSETWYSVCSRGFADCRNGVEMILYWFVILPAMYRRQLMEGMWYLAGAEVIMMDADVILERCRILWLVLF